MKPIYVTKTPNLYRIQFEYHPKLVEVIKMIPSKPRYDGTMIRVILLDVMRIGM